MEKYFRMITYLLEADIVKTTFTFKTIKSFQIPFSVIYSLYITNLSSSNYDKIGIMLLVLSCDSFCSY